MMIELIPVLEVGYGNQGITAPDKHHYWDNSEIWDAYHQECYMQAGFKDKFIPYLNGSSFSKLSDITDPNLTKLIIDHTQEMRDGKYERPLDTCAFFGGYVLQVNGQDKFYPQCCGELSDITYWERLSNRQVSYYGGHPAPQVRFQENDILFDFSTDDYQEPFQPTPTENTLLIDRFELKRAVEKAKATLQTFEQRLNQINELERLNIDNIGGLLIWENGNYN